MSNGASSSSGGQLTIGDATAAESEPPAKTVKISQDSSGQIFLANLSQSMSHHSYPTVVTQANIVENNMKEASDDGALLPLQQEVIQTLLEGNVKVLMLGIRPDPTGDSYDQPGDGMGFEYARSQWTLPHDIFNVMPQYGGSEEEEFESSDEGSKPSMPILMYDSEQFGKSGRAEF